MTPIADDESMTPVVNAVKYDRQLRLWGDKGQKRLESAKVCLINACPVGLETLKNLVLPGIGSFTIIDNKVVTNRDLGNSFFVTKDDVGKNRASVTCSYLLELNPDVRGSSHNESLESLLNENISFFSTFSVVIVCYPVSEASLKQLAAFLWKNSIPLLIPRVCGLWACVRTVFKAHYVIEAHPEGVHYDLRLDKLDHIPGLQQFVDEQDLDTMTREQHMHTPYLVILIKYLQKWFSREQTSQIPTMYKDKKRFQQLIAEGIRPKSTTEDSKDAEDTIGVDDEENFQEAIKAVNTSFRHTTVPDRVQQLFSHSSCVNLNAESDNFWIIIRAIKEYVMSSEGKGCLPVSGIIPDMTCDSQRYIRLQNLYQDAAKNAVSCVTKNVHELLKSIGRPRDSISGDEIKSYCKNAKDLDLICTSVLETELGDFNNDVNSSFSNEDRINRFLKSMQNAGENDPTSLLNIYVLFLASDEFYRLNQRYPGESDNSADLESDISSVKTCISNLINKLNCSTGSPTHFTIPDELIAEMVRFGGSTIHSMASFIGGIASHEVIKLLTNQYVPFCDVFVHNAITCSSATFKF